MKARILLYRNNFFKSHKIEAHVISVGNLTMGGSGKTPIVIYLGRLLLLHGHKVAVVSRGYKGKADKHVNIVSDGKSILLDSVEAGDEPRLIAESLPGAVVLTGRKRVHPCKYAVDHLGSEVVILDDGFQHVSVKRDVDLVLFNGATLFDKSHVFPAGVFRESFSSLKRCDGLLITNCTSENRQKISSFSDVLLNRWPSKPLFKTRFTPSHLINENGDTFALNHLSGKVYAFCGIASPQRFYQTLQTFPVNLADFEIFSDHHMYSQSCLNDLEKKAISTGAEAIITTEKDLVKIRKFSLSLPLFAIVMEISASSEFDTFVLSRIQNH